MHSPFSSILKAHEEAIRLSFSKEGEKQLEHMAGLITSAFKKGNKVLLCGNGGSAADAQHIAAEFVGRFKKERKALPAIALTTDTSILTCLANDYSFTNIFSRQLEALGNPGDILIALSTSGNSKNVIEAVEVAKSKGVVTFGFTGKKGGILKSLADFCFQSQTDETARIQEVHALALHAICDVVESEFGK